jgi:two-component system, NarL family, nitrate/nitrite response regulator NarL
MITLVIASDVRLYNEGIRQFLREAGEFQITSVTRAESALQCVLASPPMVMLLDQAMPGGLEVLEQLRRTHPQVAVVALGVPEQEDCLLRWAEAGVTGFVPRAASGAELLATIESAVRGELVCSPRFAGRLLRQLALRASTDDSPPTRPLTARETEIVRLIDSNLSNKEIAARLGIEVATVKNHVHNVLDKLRVQRRAQAAGRLRHRDVQDTAP